MPEISVALAVRYVSSGEEEDEDGPLLLLLFIEVEVEVESAWTPNDETIVNTDNDDGNDDGNDDDDDVDVEAARECHRPKMTSTFGRNERSLAVPLCCIFVCLRMWCLRADNNGRIVIIISCVVGTGPW
jgi:hypothetical protein